MPEPIRRASSGSVITPRQSLTLLNERAMGVTRLPRDVEPPSMGRVVAMPRLGRLYHRDRRIAA
jgi:hypothetical protein